MTNDEGAEPTSDDGAIAERVTDHVQSDPHDDDTPRTRVLAQGTFDILHPGHVHYLREAADMGDELYVVVARRHNVVHKAEPIVPDRQRRDVIDALEMVDRAILGHPEDIFVPVEELEPDVIALGYDQHHDEATLVDALARRGIDCEIRRASALEPDGAEELLSTGQIIDRILERRGRGG